MKRKEEVLVLLEKLGLTLGSVESITGGEFASTICSIPGASKVFKGGLVTYSIESKCSLLGIDESVIKKYGVVSRETALLMAREGKRVLGADVVVSCTGNACPSAQEGDAKVGDIWVGIAYGNNVWTIPAKFNLGRNEMRKAVVTTMLKFIESLFPAEKN